MHVFGLCEEVGMPGEDLQTQGEMQTPHKRPLGSPPRGVCVWSLHLNRNLSDLMVLGQLVLLPVFQYHFQNHTHSWNKLKNAGNMVITLIYVCFQTASTGDEALSGRSWPVSSGGGGNCLHKKMKIKSWSFNELSWWRDHYQDSEEQTWLQRGKKSNPEENSAVHVAKILSIKGELQFSSLEELRYT